MKDLVLRSSATMEERWRKPQLLLEVEEGFI
jgi:hypothetical protein